MEFLNEYRLQETLKKYCSFIAYNIILIDENKEKKEEEEPEKPLNDTHPLWLKNPKDCTDEEYKQFLDSSQCGCPVPIKSSHLFPEVAG